MLNTNFPVYVSGMRDLTPRVREYLLSSVDGSALPPWHAGAHTALYLRSPERGLIARHYSLVGGQGLQDDAPHTWRVAVQREDTGRGSAWIHAHVQEGMALEVGAPVNQFPLDRRDAAVLLLAGGIGVTPIYAMARSLVRRRRPFQLVYVGRDAADMAYHGELAELCGERAHFHYSRTQGRLDVQALLHQQRAGTRVYVCGPQTLITTVHSAAHGLGWPAAQVQSEAFGASLQPHDQAFDLTLRRSGRTLRVGADASILDTLVSHGVQTLWDCRRGECGLCTLPVLDAEGGIEHRDHCLSETDKTAGQSLCICVSRPQGAALVLDV